MAGEARDDRVTARVLWAVSRPDVDVVRLRELVAEGADLDAAADAAIGRRVGPLMWRALREAGLTDGLGPARTRLEAEAQFRRVQAGILLPRALETAVAPLVRAGLQPLVFKGPALAGRYPEPGLRPMDDVDLIVPRDEHDRAVAVLGSVGWRAPRRAGAHYDTFLVHRDVPDLPLEVHWDLETWRHRPTPLRGDDLWQARIESEIFGVPAFGLPPEVELVALAIHAGKPYHYFQRLIWSVDLAVVVERAGPALDWDRLAALARKWRAITVLAVGLRHARRLGARIPDELLHLPRSNARRGALAPLLDERWPVMGFEPAVAHRLRYGLWDSWVRVAALMLGEITATGLRDAPGRAGRVARSAARRWRPIRTLGGQPLDDEPG